MVFSDASRKQFVFAECKWCNDLKDTAVLSNLVEKSKLLTQAKGVIPSGAIHGESASFYLFSKMPFSKSCVSLANQMGNVGLISLNDLFTW